MTRRKRRLVLVLVALALLGAASTLVLRALDETVTFFYSPSDIAATPPPLDKRIRVGGLVVPGSVSQDIDGTHQFRVTDQAVELEIRYRGSLPDLFREGQGIVAEGRLLPGGGFEAGTVLAKHDETYMPPEVAKTLKDKGHWKGQEPPGGPGS